MLKTLRKYYLPGVISLVGYTVLYIMTSLNSISKERSLEILFSGDNNLFRHAKPYLDTSNSGFKYIKLDNPQVNTQIIEQTFAVNAIIKFKDYLVFDISDIRYQDFVEIINQCKIHGILNCYTYKDTILVGQTFQGERRHCGNGAPRNLLYDFSSITPIPRIVFDNGKIRRATKSEEIWFKHEEHLKKYSLLSLPFLGMLFFYFILPFIQSKRKSSSQHTPN